MAGGYFYSCIRKPSLPQGNGQGKVIEVLKIMVADYKIDADIVTILIANYQDINKARIKAQKKARTRYNDFAKLLV